MDTTHVVAAGLLPCEPEPEAVESPDGVSGISVGGAIPCSDESPPPPPPPHAEMSKEATAMAEQTVNLYGEKVRIFIKKFDVPLGSLALRHILASEFFKRVKKCCYFPSLLCAAEQYNGAARHNITAPLVQYICAPAQYHRLRQQAIVPRYRAPQTNAHRTYEPGGRQNSSPGDGR